MSHAPNPMMLLQSTLSLILCLINSQIAQSTPTHPSINLWPKPRNFTWLPPHQVTLLSPSFTITTNHHHHNKHLSAAITRYHHLIKTEHHRPLIPLTNLTTTLPPLHSLKISISNPTTPLHHGVDESYTLTITSATPHAMLHAKTAWGAMRGLETFSQLVWGHPSHVAVGVHVWDAPLYMHRGVMLDTSRNYYPVKDVLRTIEAMSMNKVNVFHWHVTDSHSFPLVLPSEPGLAEEGAYGPDMVYSVQDVKRVVEFGLDHGVRVMPEIDSPGHTGSWALAYPEIVTCANMFWWPGEWSDRLASEPGTGHLNPLNPKTYQVLKNVIHDVTKLFPEPFYHSGADEITPGCWKTDPTIQKYLSNGGTLSQVLETFINNTLPYILSLNRTAVYWEDVLLDGIVHVPSTVLPKEHVVLQTWNNGHDNTKRIVSSGYRAIVSSADFYYLDCGHGTFVGNNSAYDNQTTGSDSTNGGSWCGPFKTWQTIYNYDIAYGLSDEEAKLVLGGEVALWSEQADPTVLDARLWPRTAAMAETLWSGNRDERGRKRYGEATDRLNEWRSRMVNRGIWAEPIQPLWCIRNPAMCNTVYAI